MASMLFYELGTLLMRVNKEEDASIYFETGAQLLKKEFSLEKIPYFEGCLECYLAIQNFREAKRILGELIELAQTIKTHSLSNFSYFVLIFTFDLFLFYFHFYFLFIFYLFFIYFLFIFYLFFIYFLFNFYLILINFLFYFFFKIK